MNTRPLVRNMHSNIYTQGTTVAFQLCKQNPYSGENHAHSISTNTRPKHNALHSETETNKSNSPPEKKTGNEAAPYTPSKDTHPEARLEQKNPI